MFSYRLHWDLRPNRLAQVLGDLRRQGAEIMDLTESNPTRAGFSYPEELILSSFRDARALVYEPAPAGMRAARARLWPTTIRRVGMIVDPARIFLTASTSESYSWLFKLLADAGDEVLVPRPSYPLFEFLAQMELVRVIQYPLVYDDGWSIDLEALAQASQRAHAGHRAGESEQSNWLLRKAPANWSSSWRCARSAGWR